MEYRYIIYILQRIKAKEMNFLPTLYFRNHFFFVLQNFCPPAGCTTDMKTSNNQPATHRSYFWNVPCAVPWTSNTCSDDTVGFRRSLCSHLQDGSWGSCDLPKWRRVAEESLVRAIPERRVCQTALLLCDFVANSCTREFVDARHILNFMYLYELYENAQELSL